MAGVLRCIFLALALLLVIFINEAKKVGTSRSSGGMPGRAKPAKKAASARRSSKSTFSTPGARRRQPSVEIYREEEAEDEEDFEDDFLAPPTRRSTGTRGKKRPDFGKRAMGASHKSRRVYMDEKEDGFHGMAEEDNYEEDIYEDDEGGDEYGGELDGREYMKARGARGRKAARYGRSRSRGREMRGPAPRSRYGRGKKGKALAYKPSGYGVAREPLQARMMRNVFFLTEKVQGMASKGKKMTRELKEYFSGDFESMLLKATRPDDARPPPEFIGAILDATATFHRDEDLTAGSNPYRVTLRKLWAKMAERDWRTVAKALYLFHVLLRECEPDDVRIYKKVFAKMSREGCKKSRSRYFDAGAISAVDVMDGAGVGGAGACLDRRDFIARYSKYVLQRAKTFTSKFEEMKVIGQREIDAKDLVGQLGKAEKVLSSGLECALGEAEEDADSEVTLMCAELVARDVYDLFRLFHEKLRWAIDNQAAAFEGADRSEVAKILERFQASYARLYPQVQQFLTQTAQLLGVYGIKLRTKLEPAHRFEEEAVAVGEMVEGGEDIVEGEVVGTATGDTATEAAEGAGEEGGGTASEVEASADARGP
ncbi:c2h2 zinc-finger protein, partial [Nannochloropsis gaditana CCMP526]|uniref:c2h2 zinc-finger protein n=1 Tax=Nannochloropsis gaditana (strain CCMP526) TaxID=1093141 RepID=UPI00029F5F59